MLIISAIANSAIGSDEVAKGNNTRKGKDGIRIQLNIIGTARNTSNVEPASAVPCQNMIIFR